MPSLTDYLLALDDESATQRLAQTLAQHLGNCAEALFADKAARALQWHLYGDLGAGKTTFVRALLRASGYSERVKSPTYTLCEPYVLILGGYKIDVFHFDLYRMQSPSEWDEAGFAELLTRPGLCLIEWPEHAHLDTPDIKMTLTYTTDLSRMVKLEAWSSVGQHLLTPLAQWIAH
jgi:tRNA threonylcarbamoyladenosine biosynthesis protein TsaE